MRCLLCPSRRFWHRTVISQALPDDGALTQSEVYEAPMAQTRQSSIHPSPSILYPDEMRRSKSSLLESSDQTLSPAIVSLQESLRRNTASQARLDQSWRSSTLFPFLRSLSTPPDLEHAHLFSPAVNPNISDSWLSLLLKFQLFSNESDFDESQAMNQLKISIAPICILAGLVSTLSTARLAQSMSAQEKVLCALMLGSSSLMTTSVSGFIASVLASSHLEAGFLVLGCWDVVIFILAAICLETFISWVVLDMSRIPPSSPAIIDIKTNIVLAISLWSIYRLYFIASTVRHKPKWYVGWAWVALASFIWSMVDASLIYRYRNYLDSLRS